MNRKVRVMLLGIAACVGAAVLAPSASAINPTYAAFAGCPSDGSVFACIRADTKVGHIKIGSTDTPINKTQSVRGRAYRHPPTRLCPTSRTTLRAV